MHPDHPNDNINADDPNADNQGDDTLANDSVEEVSRSQRKREADEITRLGQNISELGAADLDRIPLDESVRDAVDKLRKITSFGAKKRQLLYLGKLMRATDLEPVYAALNAIRLSANTETQRFHVMEQWRDRLIDGNDDALAEFLTQYPNADRQRMRQLIRNSQREKSQNKPPKSARELFKLLRTSLTASE